MRRHTRLLPVLAASLLAACSGEDNSPTSPGGGSVPEFTVTATVETFGNGQPGLTITITGATQPDGTIQGCVCTPDIGWARFWTGGDNPYNQDPQYFHMSRGNIYFRSNMDECWLDLGDGRWAFTNGYVEGNEVVFDVDTTDVEQYRIAL